MTKTSRFGEANDGGAGQRDKCAAGPPRPKRETRRLKSIEATFMTLRVGLSIRIFKLRGPLGDIGYQLLCIKFFGRPTIADKVDVLP